MRIIVLKNCYGSYYRVKNIELIYRPIFCKDITNYSHSPTSALKKQKIFELGRLLNR